MEEQKLGVVARGVGKDGCFRSEQEQERMGNVYDFIDSSEDEDGDGDDDDWIGPEPNYDDLDDDADDGSN